jgi:hypothetical protein
MPSSPRVETTLPGNIDESRLKIDNNLPNPCNIGSPHRDQVDCGQYETLSVKGEQKKSSGKEKAAASPIQQDLMSQSVEV